MIRLINMSVTAGCAALIVLALRLVLQRLPKGYFYGLWLVVLFRFLCPVAVPSPLSLIPVNPEPVGQEILYDRTPKVRTGTGWMDERINRVLEEQIPAADPAALCCRGRIYESDQIGGAFVLGVFRPAVYLPVGLCGEARGYILAHEDVHIRRRDYVLKLVGLAVVVLHWFNPFAWVTFSYLCGDMEMSCDEQVVRRLGMEERKPYSLALLKAAEQGGGLVLPPSFGESHIRARIANILRCRKRSAALTEYASARMADGRVAILGECSGTGRLIDLFYGYYDPEDQVMHQVYLFIGDGKEITNPEGEVTVMGYQE